MTETTKENTEPYPSHHENDDREKVYERTDIAIKKTRSGKSYTLVINKADFDEDSDELVLNVNLEYFNKDFVNNPERTSYRFNRIRYV